MTPTKTTFESLGDFARAAKYTQWQGGHASSSSWDANVSHARAVELATTGDTSLVAKAEALLEKIDTEIEVSQASWQPSVYGAYPVVPEFLAGSVTPMRHKVLTESEYAPVTIWVDLTCSGGFNADSMLKRGISILALVMKLQASRPVTLNLISCVVRNPGGLVAKINSQPLDIASAAFGLCHVAFVRHLAYGYMDYSPMDLPVSNANVIKGKLGIPDSDLVIPGGHLEDDLISRDPVAWVQLKVKEFTENGEGD